MVKADRTSPSPQHVVQLLPNLNCSSTLQARKLPAYRNASNGIYPAYCEFPGFTLPAFPTLKTKQTDEVHGFLQYPSSKQYLKETHTGGAMQNAGPSSLQKKLLIFDHSDNKTRVFFSPVFPLDPSPVSAATEFTQACDDLNEGQEINMGQNYSNKYGFPEKYDENHLVNEESEMHEDTEEINALLYSDDNVDEYINDGEDDEVTSTDRSPLPSERIYLMQEHFEDTKEEVASSNWPMKRQKLNDGGSKRSSPTDSVSSVRLNQTREYASDAESNYVSDRICSAGRTPQEVNSMVGNIQMKKDKMHESLSALENLIPGSNWYLKS